MTEKNPAVFLQAGSHPAEDVRRMFGALVDDIAQIANPGDLLVTANGTGLKSNVAGGRMFVPGTEATYQGTYFVENRGVTTLTHDPADASLKRIDLIVARVQDAAYSGATSAWSLAIVKGTNAASPVAPTAPVNSVVLAQVSITAALTTLTSAQITDTRPLPSPPVTDSGWINLTVAAGSGVAKYRVKGGTVEARFGLSGVTIPSAAAGTTIVNPGGIPAALAPASSDTVYGTARYSGNLSGVALIGPDGSVAALNNTGSSSTVFRASIMYFIG